MKRASTGLEADGGTWWLFTVGTPVVTFGKQAPGAGAILTANAAVLRWGTAPDAQFYETCLDPTNNGVCDTQWQTTAQAIVRTVTGLTDGTYYWQVRAQTATGITEADGGAWWALTIDAPDPVRAVTSATGAPLARHDYFPFGESISPLTGDPRRFTGKELDPETALQYFDARYYRNLWGQFTTVDPLIGVNIAEFVGATLPEPILPRSTSPRTAEAAPARI